MKYITSIYITVFTIILFSQCKKENPLDDDNDPVDASFCDSTVLNVYRVTDRCADSVFYLNGSSEKKYLTVYTTKFTIYFAKTTTAEEINNLISTYNIISFDTIMENYNQELVCARGNLQEGLDCSKLFCKLDSIECELPVKFVYPYLSISDDLRISFQPEFRVKLSDINDTIELKCIADLLNSKIVGANDYNPLIYNFELKDNSGFSTFEIFNYFDNTDFFDYVTPGYWMMMPIN
jgi:hypothetical protein